MILMIGDLYGNREELYGLSPSGKERITTLVSTCRRSSRRREMNPEKRRRNTSVELFKQSIAIDLLKLMYRNIEVILCRRRRKF